MILGKACDLIDTHQLTKNQTTSPKHETGMKNEKPDKGSKNDSNLNDEKGKNTLKNDKVEEIGLNNSLKVEEKEYSTKDSPSMLKKGLPDVEDFSTGTSFVLFDNSPICTASFDRVESLSKSSSVILEEEEEDFDEEGDMRSESSESENEIMGVTEKEQAFPSAVPPVITSGINTIKHFAKTNGSENYCMCLGLTD